MGLYAEQGISRSEGQWIVISDNQRAIPQQGKATINDLPHELLNHIFSQLKDRKDIRSIARVSKLWHAKAIETAKNNSSPKINLLKQAVEWFVSNIDKIKHSDEIKELNSLLEEDLFGDASGFYSIKENIFEMKTQIALQLKNLSNEELNDILKKKNEELATQNINQYKIVGSILKLALIYKDFVSEIYIHHLAKKGLIKQALYEVDMLMDNKLECEVLGEYAEHLARKGLFKHAIEISTEVNGENTGDIVDILFRNWKFIQNPIKKLEMCIDVVNDLHDQQTVIRSLSEVLDSFAGKAHDLSKKGDIQQAMRLWKMSIEVAQMNSPEHFENYISFVLETLEKTINHFIKTSDIANALKIMNVFVKQLHNFHNPNQRKWISNMMQKLI